MKFTLYTNGNIFQSPQFQKKAFTLVELIIVITILAILATIAFMSFQGYMKQTRDANRLSTVKNIKTGLEVFLAKSGSIPQPDEAVEFTGGLKQGFIGSNLVRAINMNEVPLDPRSESQYRYSTFGNGYFYQIAIEEEGESIGMASKTYAENNQILIDGNYEFDPMFPSLFIVESSVGSEGIYGSGVCFILEGGVNSFESQSSNCLSKLGMDLGSYDSRLVSYWDMETLCANNECGVGKDGMVKNLASKDINILSGTSLKTHSGANFMTQTFTGNALYGRGSANITGWDNGLETSGVIESVLREGTVSMVYRPNETLYASNISPQYRHFLYDYLKSGIFRMTILESINGEGNGSTLYAYKFITNHLRAETKNTDLEKGKLYHITMVYRNGIVGANNSEISLYLNGRLIHKNIQEKPFNETATGTIINIGTSAWRECGSGDFLHLPKGCPANGSIDEVKVYSKALQPTEILQQAKIAGF